MIGIPGRVLCAGNLTEDILVWPVEEVVFDTTVWVEDIVTSFGGNGANTSFAIAKLGGSVRLVGEVGNDERGNHVVAQLRAAGVDTRYITRNTLPTPVTVVIVRHGGARGFLHRPGASRQAFAQGLSFTAELIEGCSHFHLANPFAMPLLRRMARDTVAAARGAGLTTSLDAGWDALNEWSHVVGPCLEYLDLLFVNEEESAKLSGIGDPFAGAQFFLSRGVGAVITKLGARGCLVSEPRGNLEVPGFSVRPADSTGAGDCFCGAFLAALQHGESLQQAARLANAAGALNVQTPGATVGLLDYPATIEWIQSRPS